MLQLAYSMFFVLPGAIGPILGQNLGAGNWDRIRETARLTARLALAYGLGMAVLLALLAPFIADLFRSPAQAAIWWCSSVATPVSSGC